MCEKGTILKSVVLIIIAEIFPHESFRENMFRPRANARNSWKEKAVSQKFGLFSQKTKKELGNFRENGMLHK
jgi:hypothetical protein